MAMTSQTMTPAEPIIKLTTDQAKEAAARLDAKAKTELENKALSTQTEIDDILGDTKNEFEDQVQAETQAAKQLKLDEVKQQAISSKSIKDLTEDDAYNLEIGIAASAAASPDFLKVVLKDKNYVARWGNRDSIRMSQLVAKGFKFITADEVENLATLEMFLDSQDHFVWADLVAMKVSKNIYYAGLRAAYVKSLHATNNKKAAEAGSAYAKSNLVGQLSGSERTYLSQQEQAGAQKPIYNPTIGV